jgi:uncharacterized ion transporter superfamily protein YfcC
MRPSTSAGLIGPAITSTLALTTIGCDKYLRFVWPVLAAIFVVICGFLGVAAAVS